MRARDNLTQTLFNPKCPLGWFKMAFIILSSAHDSYICKGKSDGPWSSGFGDLGWIHTLPWKQIKQITCFGWGKVLWANKSNCRTYWEIKFASPATACILLQHATQYNIFHDKNHDGRVCVLLKLYTLSNTIRKIQNLSEVSILTKLFDFIENVKSKCLHTAITYQPIL